VEQPLELGITNTQPQVHLVKMQVQDTPSVRVVVLGKKNKPLVVFIVSNVR
jgi:hypothetical protein